MIFQSVAAVVNPLQVTLAWDASPSPGITGYKLYYAELGHPPKILALTNITQVTFKLKRHDQEYVFYVVAVNSAGLQSDPSNKVFYTTP